MGGSLGLVGGDDHATVNPLSMGETVGGCATGEPMTIGADGAEVVPVPFTLIAATVNV